MTKAGRQVKATTKTKSLDKDRADIAIANVETGTLLGLVEEGIDTKANQEMMQSSLDLDNLIDKKGGPRLLIPGSNQKQQRRCATNCGRYQKVDC